jgi:hypothetical protein
MDYQSSFLSHLEKNKSSNVLYVLIKKKGLNERGLANVRTMIVEISIKMHKPTAHSPLNFL